jgi:hypothetical protein
MSPIVQNMLMSLVRKAIVGAGVLVVERGWTTSGEWESYVPGLVGASMVVVGAGWSLWLKFVEDRKAS